MQVIANRHELAAVMADLGFAVDTGLDGNPFVSYVRESRKPGLYESFDVMFLGKDEQVLSVGLEIRVVRYLILRWRGISVAGPIDELADDPPEGRVRLASTAIWKDWLRRVELLVPDRVAELAEAKGDALLDATREARTCAAEAFQRFVLPAMSQPDASVTLVEELDEEQRVLLRQLLEKAMVVRRGLEAQTTSAVSALILNGDPEIIAVARQAHIPLDQIARIRQMSDAAAWRLALVVDLIRQEEERMRGVDG